MQTEKAKRFEKIGFLGEGQVRHPNFKLEPFKIKINYLFKVCYSLQSSR